VFISLEVLLCGTPRMLIRTVFIYTAVFVFAAKLNNQLQAFMFQKAYLATRQWRSRCTVWSFPRFSLSGGLLDLYYYAGLFHISSKKIVSFVL
jgi:hypothetical protein